MTVSKRDEAETKKFLAEAASFEAEREAYVAEAYYHRLQSERLERARAEEDAAVESQRILDFTSEVGYGSARSAINTLAEWRAKDPGKPITVRFLTPGGDAIPGLALYDYIRMLVAEGTPVTTVGIGMAASMGAVLLQAGSTRLVTPSTWVLIHEISSVAAGRLSEMIDEAKWTERVQTRLLDILAEKSTMSKAAIKRKWMRKDWWLNAEETVRLGFADAIAEIP